MLKNVDAVFLLLMGMVGCGVKAPPTPLDKVPPSDSRTDEELKPGRFPDLIPEEKEE